MYKACKQMIGELLIRLPVVVKSVYAGVSSSLGSTVTILIKATITIAIKEIYRSGYGTGCAATIL